MGEALITRRGGGGMIEGTTPALSSNYEVTTRTIPELIGRKNFSIYVAPVGQNNGFNATSDPLVVAADFREGVCTYLLATAGDDLNNNVRCFLTEYLTFDSATGTFTGSGKYCCFRGYPIHYIAW